MTTTTTPASLWSNTRYVLWLVSDTSKGLATALVGFAIPLITLAVTNDPAQAGIVGGVGMVVRLITTLYGGVLADRHGRIALMLVGAGVATILAAGFTLLSVGDALTFGTILVIEVLLMIRAGLFEPASESALKEIVPDETMGRAQAANQGRDAALQLASGPLGGLLLGVGAWLVGVVMTLGYVLAGATAWMLRRSARRAGIRDRPSDAAADRDALLEGAAVPGATLPHGGVDAVEAAAVLEGSVPDGVSAAGRVVSEQAEPATAVPGTAAASASTAPPKANAWNEIRTGFAWLFSRPDLSGVLLIITIVNLGFNAAITTVIYGLQQAGYSELTIGTLSAILGAVMLAGALVAPMLVPRVKAGTLTIVGLAAVTIGAAVVSIVENPWWMAAVLGASVFLLPALNASMMGYFMVATPTELLGRANSAAGVLGMGAMPLAPLIAGFGLTLVGRTNTILFAAALCAVSVVLAVTNRWLRALPAESGWAAHAKQFEIR
ncbi:MFS transporter [Microbacterium sp. CIAB417]|uniref:MFS transporter n=1 Tax=Microbacterium sp. CIAB417 TaxID=2860287 RepID=UPI001FAB4A05|nr:MFS transporter [Microbacterium sp. CIAB417]